MYRRNANRAFIECHGAALSLLTNVHGGVHFAGPVLCCDPLAIIGNSPGDSNGVTIEDSHGPVDGSRHNILTIAPDLPRQTDQCAVEGSRYTTCWPSVEKTTDVMMKVL